MNRRRWLSSLGVLGSAGCVGGPPGADEAPSATNDGPDAPGSGPDGVPRYLLTDVSVERFDLGLRLNDAGTAPVDGIVAVSGLDDRERRVVESAVAGGFETDQVPAWLREFLTETRYVEDTDADAGGAGTVYRLEHTIPEYVLRASETDEASVEGEIASTEAYREAVTYDGARRTGLLRIAQREPIRWLTIDPDLEAFLERYDAVQYRGSVVAIEFDREDPGPPYAVDAETASRSEVAGGSILHAESLAEDLSRPLREAAGIDGVLGVDDPPEGLAERVQSNRFVEIDGRYYHAYAENVGDLPLAVDAEVVESTAREAHPARLRLSVTNAGDGPLEISNGPPLPFGVLRAEPSRGASVLLWTDAYEESDHVFTDGRAVTGGNSIGLMTRLDAGATAGRTYELDAEDLHEGTYRVRTTVGAGSPGEGGSIEDVPVVIEFGVVKEVA